MTHLLSAKYREQFMKEVGIPRFTMANGQDGKECTLLIKAPTLILRFLIKHQKFKVLTAKLPNYPLLWYGVRIEDDPAKPFTLWSIVEDENELEALKTFYNDGKCVLFLFNEGTINVAWAEVFFTTNSAEAKALFDESKFLLAIDSNSVMKAVKKFVDDLHENDSSLPHLVAAPTQGSAIEWHEISNNYITENAAVSSLNILSGVEGAQQEELILWILDSIVSGGAYSNTQVRFAKGTREFSDALLVYDKGIFLFESKALSIYNRVDAPDRTKLTRAIKREIRKATKQLSRGVRILRRNNPITQKDGKGIMMPRNIPPHCVIILPDLSLLESGDQGKRLVEKFMAEQEAYLHVLDPPELLSAVFSINRLLTKNPGLSRGEAFDFVLFRRWEESLKQSTLDFRYHLITSPDEVPPSFEDQ